MYGLGRTEIVCCGLGEICRHCAPRISPSGTGGCSHWTAPLLRSALGRCSIGWGRTVGAIPTAGGFLLRALATAFGAPGWVADLSPFSHLAPVPLVTPNWSASTVMLVIGAAVAAVGAWAYRRRDIRA